jgi:hypothetical protein
MEKQKKDKKVGEKMESMNAMDQGLNIISQTFNRATGVDEGNDGMEDEQDNRPQ